jgi:hypothetical protein
MANHMRSLALMLILVAGPAVAGEPKELVTAPNAVLCLSADSLNRATAGRAKGREELRELGCMRSPPGIPATLLDVSDRGSLWNVRFRPQGISDGIAMWGRASAFALPSGTPLPMQRAAG